MICQEQYCKNEANAPTPVLRTGIILCAKHDFSHLCTMPRKKWYSFRKK